MNIVLVGAGGHAKAVVEALRASGGKVMTYVDRAPADWLDARHEESDEAVGPSIGTLVFGLGGMTPDALADRLALFERYLSRGFAAEPIIHSAGWVSASARLGAGTVVLAGAVVQPNVQIGQAVIINSGAIVEHDSLVGDGTHVAPGAVVLGGCHIGSCCMIGAGSVILPGAKVPDATLVRAAARWPEFSNHNEKG